MKRIRNPFSGSPSPDPASSEPGAPLEASVGRPRAASHYLGRPRVAASLGAGAVLLAGGVMAASPASAATGGTWVLAQIKACESGGSYTAVNPSSGASGAYQFLDSTWRTLPAAADYTSAAAAPASIQDLAARQLYAQQGTAPWLASASCWQHGGALEPGSTIRSPQTVTAPHPMLHGPVSQQANGQPAGEDSGDHLSGGARGNDAEHSDRQQSPQAQGQQHEEQQEERN